MTTLTLPAIRRSFLVFLGEAWWGGGGGSERHKKGKKDNARLQDKVALITVFSLSGFLFHS